MIKAGGFTKIIEQSGPYYRGRDKFVVAMK
jgi:hypothetical protein